MPTGNWGSTDLGGTVGLLNTGAPLRIAWWAPEGARRDKGTVVLAHGRAEFIEVYAETIADLLARGHFVITFDFRGQGGSHRRTARGGHVDRFSDYVADLAAVVRYANQEGLPRPYHVLGHSMGGLVALLAAPQLEREVERLILVAPLLDVMGLPAPAGLLSVAARLGSVAGLSRRQVSEPIALPRQFTGNRLTSDPDRFETVRRLVEDNPDLVTGPPTVGWVNGAFRAMQAVRGRTGRPLAIPALFVASGQDAIVSTPAIVRFARATPGAGLVIVPGARHQILLERDGLRNLFFAAFDAYVGEAKPRLQDVRQPRFARTLSFTLGSSGPARLVAPLPAPAETTRAEAEVAAVAADARETTDGEAARSGAADAGTPPSGVAHGEEAPATATAEPLPTAAPPPAPAAPPAEATRPPAEAEAGAASDAPVPAETPGDATLAPATRPPEEAARESARGHSPPHGGARAARIRERLRRRARRRTAAEPPGEEDAGDQDEATPTSPLDAPEQKQPGATAGHDASPTASTHTADAGGPEARPAEPAPSSDAVAPPPVPAATGTPPADTPAARGNVTPAAGDNTSPSAATIGRNEDAPPPARRVAGLGRFLRRPR